MKNWLVFIACLWAFQVSAQTTYPAAGCSQAQIQAAITAEQAAPADGDIISIPAGSCTWTGSQQVNATFNNSVTIQGAGAISATTGGASTTGTDQTVILNNTTGNGTIFAFGTVAGKSFRFTGIALTQNGSSPFTANGVLNITGTSSAVRVDHCHLQIAINGSSTDIYVGGSVTGVADHDFFDDAALPVVFNMAFHNGVGWNGDTQPYGDGSWTDTEHWGSSEFFFVEDNQFSNGGLGDGGDGARYVFRHNTVLGTVASTSSCSGGPLQQFNHGADPGRYRATRAAEVYLNNYSNPGNCGSPVYSLNSGTILFWGNTITGGFANGLLVAYNFRNLAGGGGNYNYTGNWGFCGSAAGGPTGWDGNLNSASGYPCMDQPGRGKGDLLSGNFAQNGGSGVCNITRSPGCNSLNPQYPRQALSPIYTWMNTWTPLYFTANPLFANQSGGSSTGLATNNQDYFTDCTSINNPSCAGGFTGAAGTGYGVLASRPSTCTGNIDPMTGGAAPGVAYWATDTNTLYVCNPTNTWTTYYAPYTYPHPLTQSTQGASVPAPPTGLVATVQ